MSRAQKAAAALLLIVGIVSVGGIWLAPDDAAQNREFISCPPSRQFPLGTDELGRDNFSRILTGLRLSLVLASVAAGLSCSLALVAGAASGYAGSWFEELMLHVICLIESVPWLFLFLAIRALVLLNAPPMAFFWMTFAMLAVLGWTHSARVFQAVARDFRNSDALLFAPACGVAGWRLWLRQAAPGLRRSAVTQLTLLIPTFVLAEAGLGMLGLGIPEPQPSLGNLLRQLENPEMVRSHPVVFAPLVALVMVIFCFRMACGDLETTA